MKLIENPLKLDVNRIKNKNNKNESQTLYLGVGGEL